MYLLIIVLVLIILIIIFSKIVDNRNKQYFEHFKDKYNIETDPYDKQYVDICNIVENDKIKLKSDTDKIIKALGKDVVKNIVDLGCGTGYFTNSFSERGFKVVGIDKSRNMLEKATIENSKCEFVRGDIKHTNLFENNSVENIFIGKNVLNLNSHSDIVEIIRNIGKWTNKNGNVIVTMYDDENISKIFPREYSQFYKNNNKKDNIDIVSFTYLKNFRYDTWITKIKKNIYELYEKIVLKNGKYRIKKQELTILPKKDLINLFINNNFIVKTTIKNRNKYLKDNIIIFTKK